jgi:CHAT domain-containing protein
MTLFGADATETTFKQLAPRQAVLHLATHGFFLGDNCDAVASVPGARAVGGIIESSSTGKRASAKRPAAMLDSPLVLSGLALAGANRRASTSSTEDDGILTAEEVASLDLVGVQWAVLSACDTGLGLIRGSEGVLGLPRAFQTAGARTVIMSLWPAADRATRSWMLALYRARLEKGQDTADAVHDAALTALRARRSSGLSGHPFFWAGFIATGDWH